MSWTAADPESVSGFIDGAGREAALDALGTVSFDEKNEPLSPGPGCSHRGIAYSADARSTMTPRATRTLSMGVLTLPVCVLPRDIFRTMVAHQPVPSAPLVIPNDNRRKNPRQRAGRADNLTWMQKVGL